MDEFIDKLEGVRVEFDHNGIVTIENKIWKQFYQLKEKVRELYKIDFNNVTAEYEDGRGSWIRIVDEASYYDAIRWVDGIRLFIKISFDETKVIRPVVVAETPGPVVQGKKWSCHGCHFSNDPGNVRCKVCRTPKN
jgi:hypothetical protein